MKRLIKALTPEVKIYRDTDWDEYQVIVSSGESYYTGDWPDALATGLAIVRQLAEQVAKSPA